VKYYKFYKMEELNQIVRDYLEAQNTDYAIMINGDWGSGKSYYIKHDFFRVVTNVDYKQKLSETESMRAKATEVSTKVHKDQRSSDHLTKYDAKKYYPFYVSLYGISSIEDFNRKVADGVHDWIGKGIDVAKSFVKDKIGLNLPFSLGVYIPHNAVLVFDDLERICSDKITPVEVLGLINSYAEHHNKKVIIVCNESEFSKHMTEDNHNSNGVTDFCKYKEKTIRFAYTFKPDISSVYDTFAKEQQDEYAEYLAKNKEYILGLFNIGGKQNLRTLKFFVDIYYKIFTASQRVDLEKYVDLVLKKLVTTTLIYVMEYKQGIQKQDLLRLQVQSNFRTAEWLERIADKTSKSGDQKNKTSAYDVNAVQKKYGEIFNDLVHTPWIIEYIMTGAMNEKDVEDFATLQINTEKREEGSPAVQELYKLKKHIALEDDEVESVYQNVLKYIKEDQYTMYEMLDAYHIFVKYVINGIKGIKLPKQLDIQFKQALSRVTKNHTYDPMFERSAIQWDQSAMKYKEVKRYYELRNYAKELNERANMHEYKNELEQFLQVVETRVDVDAIEKYRTKDNSNLLSLRGLDWSRFYNALMTVPNPMACTVIICAESLLLKDYSTWSNEEYQKLKAFNEKLKEHMKEGDGRIRGMYMKEMIVTINDYLNKNYRESESIETQ
jgi:hypothetical protein